MTHEQLRLHPGSHQGRRNLGPCPVLTCGAHSLRCSSQAFNRGCHHGERRSGRAALAAGEQQPAAAAAAAAACTLRRCCCAAKLSQHLFPICRACRRLRLRPGASSSSRQAGWFCGGSTGHGASTCLSAASSMLAGSSHAFHRNNSAVLAGIPPILRCRCRRWGRSNAPRPPSITCCFAVQCHVCCRRWCGSRTPKPPSTSTPACWA